MAGETVVEAGALAQLGRRILEGAGVPPESARITADALLYANLRGVDSHGMQLLPFYVDAILEGRMRADGRGRVLSENGACLLYDGENCLGPVVSDVCSEHAVRLARQFGLGLVVARRSNHFAAAAAWARRISAGGMIGIVMCNASAIVPPWQGREGRIGTNPIAVSVPGEDGRPWLLDMATTTVALGQILKAKFKGEETIPPGWALDSRGVPTTSTEEALKGMPMPLGGYKGSGLGLMVEILCAVLSGGAMSRAVGGIRVKEHPMEISQFFLAIDVSRFLPLEEFRARMERLIAEVKSAAPAEGYDEVLVAGDPEWRYEEVRRRDGIPLAPGVWENLQRVAALAGVDIAG